MGLSRKIYNTGWLVRDDFPEMVIYDLGWPTGWFAVVEIERVLTDQIWANSRRKTSVLVSAVLGVLCRWPVCVLIRWFHKIPEVLHVVWLLIKAIILWLDFIRIDCFAQNGYVVLLVDQGRLLLDAIHGLIFFRNLSLQKSIFWRSTQFARALHIVLMKRVFDYSKN